MPCRCAAEQRDELAPFHSITSSARASSDRRHVEAERLRGLEVDHEFVLSRRLHREVGWLLAFKDTIDVAGCATHLVESVEPVGDQAPRGDEGSPRIDRRQSVPRREFEDQRRGERATTRSQ